MRSKLDNQSFEILTIFYLRNHVIDKRENEFGIIDMLPTILDLMQLDVPEAKNFDGKSILE